MTGLVYSPLACPGIKASKPSKGNNRIAVIMIPQKSLCRLQKAVNLECTMVRCVRSSSDDCSVVTAAASFSSIRRFRMGRFWPCNCSGC